MSKLNHSSPTPPPQPLSIKHPNKQSMRTKVIFFVFRLIVSCLILVALFKLVPYQQVFTIYKDAQKSYIVAGLGLFFLTHVLAIFRWRFLLHALKISVSLKEIIYAFLSALLFNLFFPSFVAGDVFRGFSITRRHGNVHKAASSVLLDRFSGASALAIVVIIAYSFGHSLVPQPEVLLPIVIFCSFIGFIALLIFSKNFFNFVTAILRKKEHVRKKITNFHDQLYLFRVRPKVFFVTLLFALAIQLVTAASFYVISRAFSVKISIVYFLIFVPIIMAIATIPITIAGTGTREAAAIYYLSLIHVDKSIALGMSLLNLVFLVTMGVIGGIFYVAVYHRWLQYRSQDPGD